MITSDHKAASLESFNGPIELVLYLINPFTADGFLSWRQFFESRGFIFFQSKNFLLLGLSPMRAFNHLMIIPSFNNFCNGGKRDTMTIQKISASDIINEGKRGT